VSHAEVMAAAPSGGDLDVTQSANADARRLFFGVSVLYLALYVHYGFFTFMPLWLAHVGATPKEIGILLAIPLVLRLVTVAPFCAWMGRRGRVRDAIALTAILSATVITLLLLGPGYAARIAIVVVFSIVWDQLPVLADAYAVMAVRSRGLDFGRMRVWGSIAVVVSTMSAGWIFQFAGIETLPVVVAALLLLPVLVAPLLPPDRAMTQAEPGETATWRDVVTDRTLLRAMIAAALIMGSHGVITSFGAIQWKAQGISTGTIGFLQGFAVIAEIGAFVFGSKLLGRRDPMLLIALSAIAGTVRWLIMATNPPFAVLVATQLLHSVTSTGAILGTMLVIANRVPVRTSAAAQGFYAVLLGIAMAATTAGSGLLWSLGVAPAYGAMAVLTLASLAIAWPRRAIGQVHADPSTLSTEAKR
jgi:PPP family 3-phenylpropionic acid transporter